MSDGHGSVAEMRSVAEIRGGCCGKYRVRRERLGAAWCSWRRMGERGGSADAQVSGAVKKASRERGERGGQASPTFCGNTSGVNRTPATE